MLIYFLRREIFVAVSLFMSNPKYQSCQIIFIFILNLVSSMVIAQLKVQSSQLINRLELINEFLIQAATLHMPIFLLCSDNQQMMFG